MSELVILVPVLSRPDRVKPLLDSIEAATPGARTLFLCDSGDQDEIEAVEADPRGRLDVSRGTYAQKINRGVTITAEPLIFFGADDLRFVGGWLEECRRHIDHGAQVVGVNDLLDRPARPDHATHFLVDREYVARGTIDGKPGALSESYEHNFVDDELIATAVLRGIYAYAKDAHVEHLHPMGGKANVDSTYLLGRESMRRDRRRFVEREALWT